MIIDIIAITRTIDTTGPNSGTVAFPDGTVGVLVAFIIFAIGTVGVLVVFTMFEMGDVGVGAVSMSGVCEKFIISPLTPVHVDGSAVGRPTPLSVTWMKSGSLDVRMGMV